MRTLRLAVSAWQVGRVDGVAGFARRLDAAVAGARAEGAELLMLPEYAAMEAAVQPAPGIAAELATACDQADALLAAMRECAVRHGVWLAPGSLPMRRDSGEIHNRAPLIAPDGRVAFQGKRLMTRFEAEQWGVVGGDAPGVFETPWGRIGLAICFDAEFPTLVRAQVEAGAWLVLVPGLHGHGARGRARAPLRAGAGDGEPVLHGRGAHGWRGALARDARREHRPRRHLRPRGPRLRRGRRRCRRGLRGAGLALRRPRPGRLARVREDGAVRNERSWPKAVPPARLLEFA